MNFALMYIAVRSTTMNPQQVTEFLTQVVQPRFTTIEGVGDAQILGGREFAMRVWLDPIQLAARNVTATDVLAAIRASNFLSAPGKTENEFVAYAIQTATTLQTPEAFGNLSVRANGDDIVRLSDVATVGIRRRRTTDVRVAFNGQEGTFLGVFTTPDANALDTSAAVRAELPQIQHDLPPGMTIELVYDASDNIRASIREVFKTIAEAVIIVVLVILIFLGSFRSVLVPIVTIPLSLDRRLLHPLCARLLDQPPDAARHGARDRPRGRRRDRRGGEHPPASRARRAAAECRHRRHARDLHAGRRHDHHARRRLCADRRSRRA